MSSFKKIYSSCPHIELTWQHAAREVTQESQRRVRVFWTSDLEYHLSVEIFHHSLKTVDWSYIEYHITGITDASRRRIGRCCRLASSSIPRIRSWSSTLRPKWVLTARDLTLSSICSYQPSTASTTYVTPNLRNFQVRHRSAVYLHKHIPLFIALFFFLDADLVKQLQFDS